MYHRLLGTLALLILTISGFAQTGEELDNLEAFANLFGYVRFFHPSDEASSINWDKFAVHGLTEVGKVNSQEELVLALERLFRPLAPTMKLFRTGTEVGEPSQPEAGDLPSEIVAWRHFGIDMGQSRTFISARSNRKVARTSGSTFGYMIQTMDATPYRNKNIRLRFDARTDLEYPNSGHGWLRVDRAEGKFGFFENMDDRPIRNHNWKTYTIEGKVVEDATRIVFGCFLRYRGSMWVDEFILEVQEKKGVWRKIDIKNNSFEESSELTGWRGASRGYEYTIEKRDSGGNCLEVKDLIWETELSPFEALPPIDHPFTREINSFLSVKLLPALISVNGKTLGSSEGTGALQRWIEAMEPERETRETRLAAVIIAWNLLRNFHPYWDRVAPRSREMLRKSMTRAMDPGLTLSEALRPMLVALDDPNMGLVSQGFHERLGYLPFTIIEAEGQLILENVEHPRLKPGDRLVSLNDMSAEKVIEKLMHSANGYVLKTREQAIFELNRGPQDTSVKVNFERDGTTFELGLTYAVDKRPAQRFYREPKEVANGVYYLQQEAIRHALLEDKPPEFLNARALIIDTRGFLQIDYLEQFLPYFVEKPTPYPAHLVPQLLYPDQEKITWGTVPKVIDPKEPHSKTRLYFIISSDTSGQLESVVHLIESHNLGLLIGQPTRGAPGEQNSAYLSFDHKLLWSAVRVMDKSGKHALHHPIEPDILIEPTRDQIRNRINPYVAGALADLEKNSVANATSSK